MSVRDAVHQTELAKAANPGAAMTDAYAEGKVKRGDIWRAVGIDPTKPSHQAMLLSAEKYGLDPLLKHILVIDGSGIYVTRDGWLAVAHRSEKFDGMRVTEEGETPNHWTARVAVYRKDMSHPFEYVGRYPKAGSNKRYGPEMAVKVAEVAALRRAFPVAISAPEGMRYEGAYEERWDIHDQEPEVIAEALEPEAEVVDEPSDGT